MYDITSCSSFVLCSLQIQAAGGKPGANMLAYGNNLGKNGAFVIVHMLNILHGLFGRDNSLEAPDIIQLLQCCLDSGYVLANRPQNIQEACFHQ